MGQDLEEIKRHRAFNGTDWKQLELKQLVPPFKPQIKDDSDTSNFDVQFLNESKEHSESKTIKKKQNELFKPFKHYPNIGITWQFERLIWIAYKKNIDNDKCLLAQMAKDVITHILSFLKAPP